MPVHRACRGAVCCKQGPSWPNNTLCWGLHVWLRYKVCVATCFSWSEQEHDSSISRTLSSLHSATIFSSVFTDPSGVDAVQTGPERRCLILCCFQVILGSHACMFEGCFSSILDLPATAGSAPLKRGVWVHTWQPSSGHRHWGVSRFECIIRVRLIPLHCSLVHYFHSPGMGCDTFTTSECILEEQYPILFYSIWVVCLSSVTHFQFCSCALCAVWYSCLLV